jgi:putative transposase
VLRNHDCETLVVGGVEDHIHALFALSRNHSIADIVKEIKIASSRWVKEKLPTLRQFSWQRGYGAFSGSQSQLGEVTRYIERRKSITGVYHSRMSTERF